MLENECCSDVKTLLVKNFAYKTRMTSSIDSEAQEFKQFTNIKTQRTDKQWSAKSSQPSYLSSITIEKIYSYKLYISLSISDKGRVIPYRT